MTSVVYTVGHGRSSFASLSEVLDRLGITLIVDVRSQPTSRHAPDFRKRTLEDLAHTTGIGYRWMGDALGGRPPTPDAARFSAGIEQVVELATGGPVVLLCAETDPANCHRALLIAPALEQHGTAVRHILGDGDDVPHQPPLDLEDPS
jgi:uncharacterized protein (DUF488 family)